MTELSTYPPKTCECGTEFVPRRKIDVRCSACAKRRRSTGSAKRPSRKQDSPRRVRQRAAQELGVKERIKRRRFIGIDGEGITEPYSHHNGLWEPGDPDFMIHRYKYMRAWCVGPDGLSYDAGELEPRMNEPYLRTEDILRWMWDLSRKTPEEREQKIALPSLWFYSGSYDWTHIFRDIALSDPDLLRQILKRDKEDAFETFWWRRWGITVVQAAVQLSRYAGKDDKGNARFAQAFFQDGFKVFGGGSFVSQLKAWKIGTPEEIASIEKMKAERAFFAEIDQGVRDYCGMEVRLLAELAQRVTLVASERNIRPKGGKAYSAGSYAKALLRYHKAVDHRGPDRYAGGSDRIKDILMRTFFGGWFDLFETGLFDVLYLIDLASAYPAVIRDLPCLAHGHWEDGRSDNPHALTFGHVRWEPSDDHDRKVGPFPWRFPNQRVIRPMFGTGWYVGDLIDSAKRLGRYDITELDWVSFVPECDCRPFAWIPDLYEERLRLGKDGAGLVIKVAMNSAYGSMADTLSADSPYASVVWASTITGRTQARLLDVIGDHYDDVVGVATDGIQAKNPLPVQDAAKSLGGWDSEGVITDVLAVQPGLYLAGGGDSPKKTARSRGHALSDMREIESELRAAWLNNGWNAVVPYERTRFYPARISLTRKDVWKFYGQWIDEEVSIKLTPASRVPIGTAGRTGMSAVPFGVVTGDEREESSPYDRLLALELRQAMIDERELEDAQE